MRETEKKIDDDVDDDVERKRKPRSSTIYTDTHSSAINETTEWDAEMRVLHMQMSNEY